MTDRELLELAARAYGINYRWNEPCGKVEKLSADGWFAGFFEPLTDDGDALRLAVKLDLLVVFHPALDQAIVRPYYCAERDGEAIENIESNTDRYAATRRAIVRAAAAIGEKL